jgi:predicted phage terminase large subunit-like protein
MVLPNPVNKRMGFHETLQTIQELNVNYRSPKFYVESVAYQEAMVQSMRRDTIDVTGVTPGIGKRERLSMVADKIQRGVIRFPRQGCKELIDQLVGFGVEKHDDQVDAFTTAVLGLVRHDRESASIRIVGYVDRRNLTLDSPRRRLPRYYG